MDFISFILETFESSVFFGSLFALALFLRYRFKNADRLNVIFREIGIVNKSGKLPRIKSQSKTGNITKYELMLPYGISIEDFRNKIDKLEQALCGEVILHKKGTFIELTVNQNVIPEYVDFKYIKVKPGEVILGYSRNGPFKLKFSDEYPHMIIGGTSGSGKSVFLRQLIVQLILTGGVDLYLIDLKFGVEFYIFHDCKYVKEYAENVDDALRVMLLIKDITYKRFNELKKQNAVNTEEYYIKPIFVIVDEFKNIIDNKKLKSIFEELLRICRAVNIHFIIATQRPDKDTVPGGLKANIAMTCAFKTRDAINSRILLENDKASNIEIPGRFIFQFKDDIELQSPFISIKEARFLIKNTLVRKNIETSGVIDLADREGSENNSVY
ncbi:MULTISPECIES: FtsK/SpoIIIE domain-containing protein [Thermoanaerobacterium]|uniref:DNA segregation ATPase, FtsK/SpoIIIE family n=3 Tax=Thermoanaerobacterium TaxID=28895 RepID=L0INF2_THETR|nr:MULTISPECIES: FtsK/SpoIIIE domain-containing protein [Thermoanaerobacterium]AFK94347.1 cell division FtsK/SpoIIIE [Thermoanaerobacterium saccharolyticum JW/SL-YS485]AGB20383.1 DNA segregation ATPase, FtsK/SpoIIIE family [Thermoanaerobacterium thermosaccharolyticum M0795]ETO39117.1 cell division protein FtsK [Thermoanaerobacterium aotearoense SCUT27]